jgi:hypothetical protein
MRLMFGELLHKLEDMSESERIKTLKAENNKALETIIKIFLVDGLKTDYSEILKTKIRTNTYHLDKMTHLYPEIKQFQRMFIERKDLSKEILLKSLETLLTNIPTEESAFILQAIHTKTHPILTENVVREAFPKLFNDDVFPELKKNAGANLEEKNPDATI